MHERTPRILSMKECIGLQCVMQPKSEEDKENYKETQENEIVVNNYSTQMMMMLLHGNLLNN